MQSVETPRTKVAMKIPRIVMKEIIPESLMRHLKEIITLLVL